jgi:hypothetical protein
MKLEQKWILKLFTELCYLICGPSYWNVKKHSFRRPRAKLLPPTVQDRLSNLHSIKKGRPWVLTAEEEKHIVENLKVTIYFDTLSVTRVMVQHLPRIFFLPENGTGTYIFIMVENFY